MKFAVALVLGALTLSCGDDRAVHGVDADTTGDIKEFVLPHEIAVLYRGVILTPEVDTVARDTVRINVPDGMYSGMHNPLGDLDRFGWGLKCISGCNWGSGVVFVTDMYEFTFDSGSYDRGYTIGIFLTEEPPGHMWSPCFSSEGEVYRRVYQVSISQEYFDSVFPGE